MKTRPVLFVLATLTLSLSGSWSHAQDDDPEITMRLLPAGAQASEEALRELTLPTRAVLDANGEPVLDDDGNPVMEFSPSEQALENASQGLMRANEARFEGVANGAAAAEAAQNNREEMGRGTPPDLSELLPGQVPDDVPGRNNTPGPPGSPPGRP